MKSLLLLFISLSAFTTTICAQKFVSRWQHVYGGAGREVLSATQLTKDGGFILSGYSASNKSGNKTQNANNSSNDYWVVKIDKQGNVQWNKTIGGNGDDLNTCILPTKDGGYLLGGISVSNISVNKTTDSRDSSYDFWVVKLDSLGNVLWDNTIGGIATENMHSLAEGSNYYMAVGSSYSNSGYERKQDNEGSLSWADYWIIKMTTAGKIIWSQSYGGTNQDLQAGFQICNDGGFYTGGYSYSPAGGTKTLSPFGNCDYYVVKTDSSGRQVWDNVYGGSLSDYLADVKQTSDAGFILGGYSNSPVSNNKTAPFLGGTDYWIIKTNKNGVISWDKSYGGTKSDFLVSVQQTSDKGYLLGGYSNSGAGNSKSEASRGGYDYWVVKTDSSGNVQWNKTIGGSGNDTLAAALEISAGEYLVAGTSASPVSGDKKVAIIGNKGNSDYWLVRFSVTGVGNKEASSESTVISSLKPNVTSNNEVYARLQVTLSPNPVSGELTVFYANGAVAKNIVTVMSADGKVIQQNASKNTSNTLHINVSNYAAGLYYVSLSADNKTIIRKFIKK